jgi:integrase
MDYGQLATFLVTTEGHCSLRDRVLHLTLADTGVRPGEAFALRWKDFDATARLLHIERAVSRPGLVHGTKT